MNTSNLNLDERADETLKAILALGILDNVAVAETSGILPRLLVLHNRT
jgi:hypothetical protein